MSRPDTSRRKFLQERGRPGRHPAVHIGRARLRRTSAKNVHFAYISDSHIQHIRGQPVRAQLGPGPDPGRGRDQPAQRSPTSWCSAAISRSSAPRRSWTTAPSCCRSYYDVKCVMGEHDYYLDLGEYWSELFGDHYYSWDHKGVHFVVLNSILTDKQWTHERWPSARATDAGDGGTRQPQRLPVRWSAPASASGSPKTSPERVRGHASGGVLATLHSRRSTRAGTSGPRTPKRCRRCSRASSTPT